MKNHSDARMSDFEPGRNACHLPSKALWALRSDLVQHEREVQANTAADNRRWPCPIFFETEIR